MEVVVVINGLGGSGKSQFCTDCIEYCKNIRGVKAYEFSTIDYIKTVARVVGWNGKKDEKGREFLHNLKIAFERFNDYPNIDCLNNIKGLTEKKPKTLNICFVNIREAYNIENFKKMCEEAGYKVLTMKVVSPRESNETPEVAKEIDKIDYDIVINNDGKLKDLQKKAIDFVETLRNEN